ncbi:MAG: potassium-transporting ATPase subunit B, partial [Scytonema sp. CRU_2_7]|nr:potassium-transporting ATPase subunit B [Scytonema sp. CRU_2_7]
MDSTNPSSKPSYSPRKSDRRQARKQSRVNTKGLYRRAIKDAFVKLNPKYAIKNPVMFLVWVGTIITLLVTIDPYLFGPVPGKRLRLFNGLITGILFFTVLFANFAEAIAEGRGKAQADALRSTKSETIAKKLAPDGSVSDVPSTSLRTGDTV